MYSLALVDGGSHHAQAKDADGLLRLSQDSVAMLEPPFQPQCVEIWRAKTSETGAERAFSATLPADILLEIAQAEREQEAVLILFAGEIVEQLMATDPAAAPSPYVRMEYTTLAWEIVLPRYFQGPQSALRFRDPLGWFANLEAQAPWLSLKTRNAVLPVVDDTRAESQYQQERLGDLMQQKRLDIQQIQALQGQSSHHVVKKKWFKVVRQKAPSDALALKRRLCVAELSASLQSQKKAETLALLQSKLSEIPQLEQHPLKWLIQGEFARGQRIDVAEACFAQALQLSQSAEFLPYFGELEQNLCRHLPRLRLAELQLEYFDFAAFEALMGDLPEDFRALEQLRLQILAQALQGELDEGAVLQYVSRLGRCPAWLEALQTLEQEERRPSVSELASLMLKIADEPVILQWLVRKACQLYSPSERKDLAQALQALWLSLGPQSDLSLALRALLSVSTGAPDGASLLQESFKRTKRAGQFWAWSKDLEHFQNAENGASIRAFRAYSLQAALLLSTPEAPLYALLMQALRDWGQAELQAAFKETEPRCVFVLEGPEWEGGADILLKSYIESFVFADPCLLLVPESALALYLQALAWAHSRFEADLIPRVCLSSEVPEGAVAVRPWRKVPAPKASEHGIQPFGSDLSYVYQREEGGASGHWIEVQGASVAQTLRASVARHGQKNAAEDTVLQTPDTGPPAELSPQLPLPLCLLAPNRELNAFSKLFQSIESPGAQFCPVPQDWYFIQRSAEQLDPVWLPFLADWCQRHPHCEVVYLNSFHSALGTLGLPQATLVRGRALERYVEGVPGLMASWVSPERCGGATEALETTPRQRSHYFAEIHVRQYAQVFEENAGHDAEGEALSGQWAQVWRRLQGFHQGPQSAQHDGPEIAALMASLPQADGLDSQVLRNSLQYLHMYASWLCQDWSAVLKFAASFPYARYWRAQALLESGDWAAGKRELELALHMVDGSPPVQHLFPRLSNLELLEALSALPEPNGLHTARLRKIKGG